MEEMMMNDPLVRLELWANQLLAENPHGLGENLASYAREWRKERESTEAIAGELSIQRNILRTLEP